MRGTVIRETGWTFETYNQQPSADVMDLLQHMHEEPPAYRILAWVNLKPKVHLANGKKALEETRSLPQSTGMATLPTTPEIDRQMTAIRALEEKFHKRKKK